MVQADVLVPHRHSRIAVAENRHDRPLRYCRHRQRACGVVTDVVKAEILESEASHQTRKAARDYLGITLEEATNRGATIGPSQQMQDPVAHGTKHHLRPREMFWPSRAAGESR